MFIFAKKTNKKNGLETMKMVTYKEWVENRENRLEMRERLNICR